MSTEDIVLVDYDPQWPVLFAEEAMRVRQALGNDVVVRIEHFGSTSVPGMQAKPILDLLIGVTSLPAAIACVAQLEVMGYSYWRDNPNKSHLFCVKGLPPNGPRTHHLHIVELDSPFWERLSFRDYLRDHPEEARRYEDLKRELARQFSSDRDAYTQGKTEYVQSVMEKARVLAQSFPIVNQ